MKACRADNQFCQPYSAAKFLSKRPNSLVVFISLSRAFFCHSTFSHCRAHKIKAGLICFSVNCLARDGQRTSSEGKGEQHRCAHDFKTDLICFSVNCLARDGQKKKRQRKKIVEDIGLEPGSKSQRTSVRDPVLDSFIPVLSITRKLAPVPRGMLQQLLDRQSFRLDHQASRPGPSAPGKVAKQSYSRGKA